MTSFRVLLFVIMVSLTAAVANAADRPQPPSPPEPPMPPMPFMFKGSKVDCDKPPMLAHLKEKLTLNADQESKISTAMKQHCETMKSAHQALADTMEHVLSSEQRAQLETLHREGPHRQHRDGHHEHHGDGKRQ